MPKCTFLWKSECKIKLVLKRKIIVTLIPVAIHWYIKSEMGFIVREIDGNYYCGYTRGIL